MISKCPTCKHRELNEIEEELICEKCGSAFGLEYLGMYEEGSNDRIDEGFESEEWKQKYKGQK